MTAFPLKILTPDGVAYDGTVTAVSCRTIDGQIQLLANHIDYTTALGMGEAHITREDGTKRRAACMGGMVSMIDGECRLLATTFEWAEDIDKERA
ncbi:MAG: F0F1 ATP synthase subunit epsilon, partial [Gemmiger sp.]|nr:F0F1 ATP synthase subunit epsilon [Gemmiger sp.]